MSASGATTLITASLTNPNGILVSPDGDVLYVSVPDSRQVFRARIDSPGRVRDMKAFFTGSTEIDRYGPDGMACDSRGNVYAAYHRFIAIISPEGRLLGRIKIPEHATNCTFGGQENATLFVTTQTSLFAVRMPVSGMTLRRGVSIAAFDAFSKGKEASP